MNNTESTLTDFSLLHLSDVSATFASKGVEKLRDIEVDGFSEEKKKQIAKNFESILLNKLFDQMQNTIGDWGFDNDGASKQIQGLFWLYLAQNVADKGGFGLWKEIYKFLTQNEQVMTNTVVDDI
jgi:Rod binding domain-containing protein